MLPATPIDVARSYRAKGVQTVMAYMPGEADPWKRPRGQWRHYLTQWITDKELDRWAFQWAEKPNLGMVCGEISGRAFVIDIDVYKSDQAAAWWGDLLSVFNGAQRIETPTQRTGGGGTQMIFRAPVGWRAPTGISTIGVDCRGEGGFAMLPPSLHSSGEHYRWLPGLALDEVEIAVAPKWLCDEIDRLLAVHPGLERVAEPATHSATHANGHDKQVAEYVARSATHSPRLDGVLDDGREAYMTRLIWAAVVGARRECPFIAQADATELRDKVWSDYLFHTDSRLSGAPDTLAARLEQEGRGQSLFLQKWDYAFRQWDGKVAAAAALDDPRPDRPKSASNVGGNLNSAINALPAHDPETGEIIEARAVLEEKSPLVSLATVDPFPFDPAKIPRRDWLVPNLLLRGHLSLLVAPPGTGKSLLSLQATIMLATGRQWGGWTPRKPANSLIISIEDDLDEMRRRIWAACQVMNVDPASLAGRIRMVSHAEDVIIMRRGRKTGEIVATDLEARIAATRGQWEFDNLVVDPLSETHEVTENSNDEVKAVAAAWRGVGRRVGLSVLAIHHTPKNASSMAGSLDAARGGGALGAIARIGATLFDMSDEEADALGIDRKDRRDYAGYDDAKVSYGKLIAKKWFVKQSVVLPNHGVGVEGDSVGAFVPWEAPDAFDGMTAANLHDVQNAVARGKWRYSPQAADWVGKAVADTLGMDVEIDSARIKNLLKVWIKNGSLLVATGADEGGRKRPCVIVGEWVKPDDIA